MYVEIKNPEGTREIALEPGRGYCFKEAFDCVLNELKKGAVSATIFAENPTDASFGGLSEHIQFKNAALPLFTLSLGQPEIVSGNGEVTSPEVATMAGRILSLGNPLNDPTVTLAVIEGIAESNSGTEAQDVLKRMFGPFFDNMLSIAGSALTQAANKVGNDKIVTVVDIDYTKVANAIVGAIEGGYSPWFSQFEVADDQFSTELRQRIRAADGIWYSDPEFWAQGGNAKLCYDIPDEDEGEMNGHLVFGKAEIQRGLQIMAAKYPRHFADLVSENDDAETHDVFMQCAVLEDVIYG